MRLRIDCAYDGAEFSGWATQPGLRTVQATLEEALATVLRTPQVRVTVAGRTDAGVHARGQVAHLDVDPEVVAAAAARAGDVPLETLARRVDGVLPPDLRVRRVSQAPADRIRTLLLRADNVLKNEGEQADRTRRARLALEEARELSLHPSVDGRVRELVERRLAGLDDLAE